MSQSPAAGSASAAATRRLKHRRSVVVDIYARDDGDWEVEAQLTDTKTRSFRNDLGERPAGAAVHDMRLRLVIDRHFTIKEAHALSAAVPYPGYCEGYGSAYEALVGLNLLDGFRRQVRARLGGSRACTHMTELAQFLPTAVVQGFAGEVLDVRGEAEDSRQPFQIDRCHALRADGPAVARFYPRWARPAPGLHEAPLADSDSSHDQAATMSHCPQPIQGSNV
jgi:hypothetical protein